MSLSSYVAFYIVESQKKDFTYMPLRVTIMTPINITTIPVHLRGVIISLRKILQRMGVTM